VRVGSGWVGWGVNVHTSVKNFIANQQVSEPGCRAATRVTAVQTKCSKGFPNLFYRFLQVPLRFPGFPRFPQISP